MNETAALDLARQCYESSTSYVDTNYRKKWEYSLRAFQNEHAPGSKYLSDDYKGRSKLFRPKTRTIIRKAEAAAAMTIGNLDNMYVQAEDPNNLMAVANADVMDSLLRYRLKKTIPWYITVAGAMQDAKTIGVVCSYNYWDYVQKTAADGARVVLKDEPCIELRAIENIRIDPGAKWTDPVNSSPYFIDIIPMYAFDVRQMMTSTDNKTGAPAWKKYGDDEIVKACPDMIDSTRQVRQGRGFQDPAQSQRQIADHDIVWVMRHFIKHGADDWCFYTLGTHKVLTTPKVVEDVYFHGERPYTMGAVAIETHKAIPDGPTWLSRQLQLEMNDNVNSRMDNVKLVLNKRYLVARGHQVDVPSLLRNVPGGVTLMTDPKGDVVPLEWNDVTQSAYIEQDKLGQDFADLVGDFSPNTRFANTGMSETLGGSKMAMSMGSAMTEYENQTLIETWVEPTMRQLIKLEQAYETNETILYLAGKNAKLMQRFGMDRVTDTLLMQSVTLSVDVGMGSTDPASRLQKFLMATNAVNQIVQTAPPGANVGEMVKEVYRNAGYKNGDRFMNSEIDPRLPMAFQKIQQLQAEIQTGRYETDVNARLKQLEIESNQRSKDDETRVNAARIDADSAIRAKEIQVSERELDIDVYKAQLVAAGQADSKESDARLKSAQLLASASDMDSRADLERRRLDVDEQAKQRDADRADREEERAGAEKKTVESNEARVGQVAEQVATVLKGVMEQVKDLKTELTESKKTAEQVSALSESLLKVTNIVAEQMTKPKPKGFKKKVGSDGRKSFIIVMEDGSESEISEQ